MITYVDPTLGGIFTSEGGLQDIRPHYFGDCYKIYGDRSFFDEMLNNKLYLLV
ncbi:MULTISPECIES: hypothetical protein [Kamptonema]|uniref:hypothetical protein n=1 Tax=Kamptonema TaxID=1501433 RepID=UPI0001DAC1D4|nr:MULTISPECIES: hypothetical protein [Kamptonema]CBN58977.1 hypothetical protein OSCI_3960023 [Kamptonema sp. PCC 6506]